MKGFYGLVSLLGHPLFLPFYLLTSSLYLIPNFYGYPFGQKALLLVFQSFVITILLPAVAIGLMSKLGLIESLTMENRKERFVPIVVVLTLFLWFFINIKDIPFLLSDYVHYCLGVIIGLVLLLLMTIFFKISMHASSWTLLAFYAFVISTKYFGQYDFPEVSSIRTISKIYPWSILGMGLFTIFARHKLGAHSYKELFWGVILGLFCGVISFAISI